MLRKQLDLTLNLREAIIQNACLREAVKWGDTTSKYFVWVN